MWKNLMVDFIERFAVGLIMTGLEVIISILYFYAIAYY